MYTYRKSIWKDLTGLIAKISLLIIERKPKEQFEYETKINMWFYYYLLELLFLIKFAPVQTS